MDDKQFAQLMQGIRSLENKLDILIAIMKSSAPEPTIGDEEKKILQLCNKKHSIADMVLKTGKTTNNVNVILSNLRSKGLIKSMEVNDKLVYVKI